MTAHIRYLLAAALVFAAAPSGRAATTDTDKSAGPAAPLGDWRVGPVMAKDGSFAYCLAEVRYNNGQSLIIARNPRDEFNIGLGMPSAHLVKGSAWKVKVVVDGSFKRDRQAVSPDPDMLVIANGNDDKLFDALTHGTTLSIEGPADTAGYQLRGTGKALTDLKSCVERARSGQPAKPLGRVGDSTRPELPLLLKKLLAEAGFKTVGLIPAATAPTGYGAVDYAWKIGPVTAGIIETRSQANPSLSNLTTAALDRLKARCAKGFDVKEGNTESLPGGSVRAATVTCGESTGNTTHIALVFNLGRGGLFKTFFHEAPATEAATADQHRDAIAEVLKRVSNL